MIVILLGKSASGKDTIARKLVKARPTGFFTKLVGTTSRPIRENEKNGVDYNFVSKDEFLQLINNDMLLEYRAYNTLVNNKPDTWYYGFSKTPLDLSKNYIVVLDVDGAKHFISYYGAENCYVVFVDASDSEREYRARKRGSFDKSEWDRRNADDILKFYDTRVISVCDQYYKNCRVDYVPINLINLSSIFTGLYLKSKLCDRYVSMSKLADIVKTNFPYNELKKNKGISEFYTDGPMSIGVSFEDCDIDGRNEEVYVYNLFYRDQYIDISSTSGYGRPNDLLPLEVLNHLCMVWNKLLV